MAYSLVRALVVSVTDRVVDAEKEERGWFWIGDGEGAKGGYEEVCIQAVFGVTVQEPWSRVG